LIFARPVSSALVVDSSTTSAAASAAAPRTSPAIDVTPITLRCAAFVIASLAFVVMLLTIESSLLREAFDNSNGGCAVPRGSNYQSRPPSVCRTPPIKCGPKPTVSSARPIAVATLPFLAANTYFAVVYIAFFLVMRRVCRSLARLPFTRTRRPRDSEKSNHPTPAAMRRQAIGLRRAWRTNTGRTSSAPPARGSTPSRSLARVAGET
jgi:hypothetical protein